MSTIRPWKPASTISLPSRSSTANSSRICAAGRRELELERRLAEQSGVDPLTGLANSRALESRLSRQLSAGIGQSSFGACVLMEVDFLHRRESSAWPRADETVLPCLATKLLELTGDSALLAYVGAPARGSGRFAILLSQTSDEEATAWTESLRRRWAEAEIVVGNAACSSPQVSAWPALPGRAALGTSGRLAGPLRSRLAKSSAVVRRLWISQKLRAAIVYCAMARSTTRMRPGQPLPALGDSSKVPSPGM